MLQEATAIHQGAAPSRASLGFAGGGDPMATEGMLRALAAPIALDDLMFRAVENPRMERGGQQRWMQAFAPYLRRLTIERRLDAVVFGLWHFRLLPLPVTPSSDGRGEAIEQQFAFVGELTIRGITRHGVGMGKDYKVAATDALKRAAQQFGVGRELIDLRLLVHVSSGDPQSAQPLEDVREVYRRALEARAFGKSQSSGASGAKAGEAVPGPAEPVGRESAPGGGVGPTSAAARTSPAGRSGARTRAGEARA